MRRWVEGAYLLQCLPKVFAVGHVPASREARLWGAVLYAGPGAALSHGTAAHHYGLIDYPPERIEVSTARKINALRTVAVHARRRNIERRLHDGIPVTTVPQTMLDLAATAPPKLVRKALARLDYNQALDFGTLAEICGKGRTGSSVLLSALEKYNPRLAHVNSPLEYDFFEWCERRGVRLPLVNLRVHGVLVDAYWPTHGVVVELDGVKNHSSRAQLRRDKANDLKLRSYGLVVLRYDRPLLDEQPDAIYDELTKALAR